RRGVAWMRPAGSSAEGAVSASGTRPLRPTAHARNNIRAAISLLAWLRGRGTTLADAGQADIDQWLHAGPSAVLARDFLSWAPYAATAGEWKSPLLPAPSALPSARTSGGHWPPGCCTTPRSTRRIVPPTA